MAGTRAAGALGPGLVESLARYWRLVVLLSLAAGLAAGGLSLLQPERYEATARMFLAERGSAGVFEVAPSGVDPDRYAKNQAELVMSRPVAERAAELVDGRLSSREIRERVEATSSADFDLVTVRAADATAAGAAELADAVSRAYQLTVSEEVRAAAEEAITQLEEAATQLEERIAETDAQLETADSPALVAERDGAIAELASIERRINQLSLDAGLFGSGVRLSEQAEVPLAPVQPRPLRNGAFGLVLGALAASAYAYWRADHAQQADDRSDPASVLQAPLLGEIPDFGAIGASAPVPARESFAVEAYAFVLSSLEFTLDEDQPGRTVLFTSPQPQDGKTTTALNLALAARRDGRRVVLVDADERVRGLSHLAGLDDREGLTDLGEFAVPSHWCLSEWEVVDGMSVGIVPAGTSTDGDGSFFHTARSRTAMDRVRAQADMVLVDAPPLLAVSDTSAMAARADGMVLVVRRGTPLRLLEECRARLQFIGTPLLGYVFNRSAPPRGRLGAYRYGYGENGSSSSSDADTAPAAGAQERHPSAS